MPIDWKAMLPFKTFTAHNPVACTGRSERSISSIGRTESTPNKESNYNTKSLAITANKEMRHFDTAVGILETQKTLLQRIARKKNAIKGLVDEYGEREASRTLP